MPFHSYLLPPASYLLTELPLEDLAGGADRQRIAELDSTRVFVGGELLAAPGEQLLLRDRRPRLAHDEGLDFLPEPLVRDADNGNERDSGMSHHHLFEFTWIHIHARPDHHVLLAVDDREVPVRIERPDIAGMEPPVPHDFSGRVRPVVVALHDVRSADHDLAALPRRHRPAAVVDAAHVDTEDRLPHRARLARTGQLVETGHRRRLREAVAFQHTNAE